VIKNKGKKCQVADCRSNAISLGYCSKHYQQIKLTGKIKQKSFMFIEGLCSTLGCGNEVFAKGFCQKCYTKNRKLDAEKRLGC
jgi:hypothetical protein